MNGSEAKFKPSSPVDVLVRKKISFFSTIMLVIGNSIGAGIFFKSSVIMKYSGGSLPVAILSWLAAGFIVICMALALVEVSLGRNDNLAIVGWCKKFNGRYLYKSCKYFMTFVYLPLNFFVMPLYVLLPLQEALGYFGITNEFNTSSDWAIWSAIGLFLMLWFIISAGLSSRFGNIQNKIITFLKFLPLIFAATIGWIIAANDGFMVRASVVHFWNSSSRELFQISPLFGIFGSLAAIFFAYDGFYATAGIQTEMREPKKTPKALLFGLSIVTVIYLLIAISMSVVSDDGNLKSFSAFLEKRHLAWILGIVSALVAVGVMGILNGYSMWCARYLQDLIKEGELPVPIKWFKNCQNDNFPIVGVILTIAISVPVTIIFDIIGGLGYFPGSRYGQFDKSTARLYNFADLMATWCAVFAFAFIACAIYGCIRNRKTNHVKVERTKYFLPAAWIAVVFVFIATGVSIIQPLVDIGLSMNKRDDFFLGSILLVVILIVFVAVSLVPIYFEKKAVKSRLDKLELLLKSIQIPTTITLKSGGDVMDEYVKAVSAYIEVTKLGVDSFKTKASNSRSGYNF